MDMYENLYHCFFNSYKQKVAPSALFYYEILGALDLFLRI